jgi:small-conductance mechanosensitive channel
VLPAFLPGLKNRLGTMMELHAEIGRRFAAVAIEIIFPQRDVQIQNRTEVALPPPARALPTTKQRKLEDPSSDPD